MKSLFVILSVIGFGASQCAAFLWNNNKPFWMRPTSSKPARQIITTTTPTTTEAPPTPGKGFFFSSAFASSSSSGTGSSSATATSSSSSNPFSMGKGLFGLFDDLFNHDICPMIKGLPTTTDVRQFKGQCYFTGSRCGRRCGRNEMCCATNVEGECAMACVKGVSEKRKAGSCPADMTRRPTGGIAWLHEFCRWARATEATKTPNSCRVDEDCEGTSKCCSSLPTKTDILGACERKCVAPVGLTTEATNANAASTTTTTASTTTTKKADLDVIS